MAGPLTHDSLAGALLHAVRDALVAAPRFDPAPNLDLAVVALPRDGAPVWADVLFSREYPRGLVAQIGSDAGAVRNVRYLVDPVDTQHRSIAWVAGSDWTQLPAQSLRALAGDGPQRFIAPYPASLVKLMVAVGVAHLVDLGHAAWDERWTQARTSAGAATAVAPTGASPHQPTLAELAEAMLVSSDNDATDALVALLHARGLIRRVGAVEHNGLHELFARHRLHTLRLAETTPAGGWRNADGAGVGHLQMTAWDSVRLLWLLLDDAPPPPWLGAGAPLLLSAPSRRRLWGWLADQGWHEVLSSTLLAGVPGWQRGVAARLPARWIAADGSAQVGAQILPADVRPASRAADASFAHKTGHTESYASDAGLVLGDGGRRYLIALITTLGQRQAPHPACATDWCLPRIGAAVDDWLKVRLE